MKIFYLFTIIILYSSLLWLSQLNFGKFHTFAQEVPLIPIQSGNATLDQGLPIFYDCLDNIVDESFSEQEDNYFKHEPRKSEVVECYNEAINAYLDGSYSREKIDAWKERLGNLERDGR